jgi:hypothetical protein
MLPALPRMFLLLLFLVAGYSVFTAIGVLIRLRALAKSSSGSPEALPECKTDLNALRSRITNLRNVLIATACVFGFVYFMGMQFAYFQIVNSKTPGGYLILEDFYPHFVVGANASVIFLALHRLQWFVANRVRAVVSSRL